jgi:hypothetical protein
MFTGTRLLQIGYATALAVGVILLVLPGTSDGQGFRGTAGFPPPPATPILINNLGGVGFPGVGISPGL